MKRCMEHTLKKSGREDGDAGAMPHRDSVAGIRIRGQRAQSLPYTPSKPQIRTQRSSKNLQQCTQPIGLRHGTTHRGERPVAGDRCKLHCPGGPPEWAREGPRGGRVAPTSPAGELRLPQLPRSVSPSHFIRFAPFFFAGVWPYDAERVPSRHPSQQS